MLGDPKRLGATVSATPRRVGAVALAVIVSVFATCTALYNFPDGAARDSVKPVVAAMDPLLTQNWNLFAPTPPTSDMGVLVRVAGDTTGTTSPTDETQKFVDLTTPGLDTTKRTLVPSRMHRALTGALDTYLSTEDEVLSLSADAEALTSRVADREKVLADALRLPETVKRGADKRYLRDRDLFIRAVLGAFPDDTTGADACGRQIQVRLVHFIYPRFESRHAAPERSVETRTLQWWPTRDACSL